MRAVCALFDAQSSVRWLRRNAKVLLYGALTRQAKLSIGALGGYELCVCQRKRPCSIEEAIQDKKTRSEGE
jgi:hypothetical protein